MSKRGFYYKQILKTLFEIVLLEDCGNQWSLSRPILSLILINEQVCVICIFPKWAFVHLSNSLQLLSHQIFSDLKAKILSSQMMIQNSLLFTIVTQVLSKSWAIIFNGAASGSTPATLCLLWQSYDRHIAGIGSEEQRHVHSELESFQTWVPR